MLVRYSSTAQDLVTNAENSWDLGWGGTRPRERTRPARKKRGTAEGEALALRLEDPPARNGHREKDALVRGERGAGGQTEGQRGSCGTAEAAERKPERAAPNAGERSGGTRPRPSRRRHPGWGGLCVRDNCQRRQGRPPPVSTRLLPLLSLLCPGQAGRPSQSAPGLNAPAHTAALGAACRAPESPAGRHPAATGKGSGTLRGRPARPPLNSFEREAPTLPSVCLALGEAGLL